MYACDTCLYSFEYLSGHVCTLHAKRQPRAKECPDARLYVRVEVDGKDVSEEARICKVFSFESAADLALYRLWKSSGRSSEFTPKKILVSNEIDTFVFSVDSSRSGRANAPEVGKLLVHLHHD